MEIKMEFKEGDIIRVRDWGQLTFCPVMDWFERNLSNLEPDWLVRFNYDNSVKEYDKEDLFKVLYIDRDCLHCDVLLITSNSKCDCGHTYLMDACGCELIERKIESSSASVLPAKAQIERNGKIINLEGTMDFSTGELHLTEKKGE